MPRLAVLSIASALVFACSSSGLGQGVAGASIGGHVSNETGTTVANARLTLTNASTGNLWRAVTGERGTFLFADLPTGGPYLLEATAIGFQPSRLPGIVLHVGDRAVRDLTLSQSTPLMLEGVLVRASELRDPGAGGAVHSVPGDVARNLPLLNRDFVGLFALSPLATGTAPISLGGQNPRFNAIQVDGGSAGDFFGVSVTPGAGTGARSLPLEAVEEIRILVAPFDVRQGGFSGGLINAVTRSGTNEFRSSGYASLAGSGLVGVDTAGSPAQRFATAQYGFSVGGPIVRNRLHYFVVGEAQVQRAPAVSDVDMNDSVAGRIADITRDVYQFNPGGPARPTLQQPNWNLFTKLSWQASDHHLLEVSLNSLGARSDQLSRSLASLKRDGWPLSSSGVVTRSSATTIRVGLRSAFGAVSNDAIASYSTMGDAHQSQSRTPLFLVQTDVPSMYVAAGSTVNGADTRTAQQVLELSDNLSWIVGSHVLTIGTQDQVFHVRDNLFLWSWGSWTFSSSDAYQARQPSQYQVALPTRPGGPVANYSPSELAGFVQDRWSVTSSLSVSAGVRVDIPLFPAPQRNESLLASTALGHLDTGVFPSGNAVVSPRFGFSYGFGARHDWVVRGGLGAFTGRLPLVWPTNAYSQTGTEQTLLTCTVSDGVPPPVTDIRALPSHCLGASGRTAVPTITTAARDLRAQQAVKLDLGLDHDLGNGFVASIDVLHTTTRNTLTITDVNLLAAGLSAEGRQMYGAIGPAGARPSRLDGVQYGPVYRFENRTGDRATSLSIDLQRDWTTGAFVQAGYQWSRTEDLMSVTGLSSSLLFQNNPIDGTIADRRLRRSARDVPHNLVAAAVVPLLFHSTGGVFFRAHSGAPYAYVAGGDANLDGTSSNDLSYVPRDSSDITLTDPSTYRKLDAYIEGERCLRTQRGRVMARNSCRNPNVYALDGRLGKRLGGAEINVDVFNLPNLLRHDWGLARETANREFAQLLTVTSWDNRANRPLYKFVLPSRNHVVTESSRWRIQLGARVAVR